MPLPPSVTLIPLHGKILRTDPGGTPAGGWVVFTPPYVLRDTLGNVILGPVAYKVHLDVNGEFTVALPASDDPDLVPSGWTWQVDIRTDVWTETFRIVVPVATVGTLELADLVPVVIPPVIAIYALVNHAHADLIPLAQKGAANGVATLDAGVKVPFVQLPAGVVAGTVATGDDPRFVGPHPPTPHAVTHATGGTDPLTPAAIGAAVSTRQVATGAGLTGGGDLTADRTLAVVFGAAAATVTEGNDPRLSDARTPTAHVHPAADITSGTLAVGRLPVGTIAGTVAAGDDARMTDARTPTAHAASHATAGSDPVTPAAIGAFPITGGTITGSTQVNGDLQVQGVGKAYRFRTSGGALDVDGSDVDLNLSMYSGPGFAGVQRKYFRLETGAQKLHLIGPVVIGTNEFGEQIKFDPGAIPTVTGSRLTGAALVSLLTTLAAMGLIVDGTTA